MKNIYYILLFAAFCLLFTGCSSDDDANGVSLKIVKSDVSFEDIGGEGSIEVFSESPFEVAIEVDWCTYTVSGNTIKLNVTPNTSIEGRNATVTIISGDEAPVLINVIQAGGVFFLPNGEQRLHYALGGGSKPVDVYSSQPYLVEIPADCDWLTYAIKNDKVIFTATKAEAPRKTVVVNFRMAEKTIPLEIGQSFGYDDFIGTFKLSYTDFMLKPKERIITLSRKEEGISYIVSGLEFEFEMQYNPANGGVYIRPQKVGRGVAPIDGEEYDIFLGLFSSDIQGSPTIDPKYAYVGVWNEEVGGFNIKFVDGGGWLGPIDLFCFAFFDFDDKGDDIYIFDYVDLTDPDNPVLSNYIWASMEKQ